MDEVLDRAAVEDAIRRDAESGRFESAATMGLEQYGAELLGFLHALLRTPPEADEAFSAVCERMWRGLPRFEWRCSFRTWMYAIARNEASRQSRRSIRDRRRVVSLAAASEVARMAVKIRSSTALPLRTESKERLHAIRDTLEPDERMLLVLRLDRGMPWREIAIVLEGEALSDDDLAREAARLRQQFTRLKAKVTRLYRSGSRRIGPG